MVWSTESFNQNIANIKAEREKSCQTDPDFRKMCLEAGARYRAYAASLGPWVTTETPEPPKHNDEPFSFKPTIFASDNQQLDVEKTLELIKLYKQGEEKGARILRALNDRPTVMGVGEVDEKRRRLNRCAVYAMIKEETDRAAQLKGLVDPDPRYPLEAVEILEEYWAVSQTPNTPEIVYMGRATGLGYEGVLRWFKEKRERLKPLFLAREAIPTNGPGVKWMAMRQLARANGVPEEDLPKFEGYGISTDE